MIERVRYAGWEDCLRLTDGRIEVVAATEVGPRILRFGAVGGRNLLHEVPGHRGRKGGAEWRSLGGHRLWHAPEARPRTYAPDNDPVRFEVGEDRVRLVQETESSTGIQKTLELRLEPGAGRLFLAHRLGNLNPWPVELAPWAITMMAAGGTAVLPQEPFAPHPDSPQGLALPCGGNSYLPVRTMALWSYTRLDDPRWTFLDRHILLKQDPAVPSPMKFGAGNRRGWCGYFLDGEMLLKQFAWTSGARYPDEGCNNEFYVDADMLEVETLGPLATIPPGGSVEHHEVWHYLEGLPIPFDPASLEAALPFPG